MSIISKIDPKKLPTPSVRFLFLLWLFFSILTVLVFYFNLRALNDIDVPTHIGAGLVITAFIFTTVKVERGRDALALAIVPFILWEFIELGITARVADGGFLFRLFDESFGNQVQDVLMDTLGFFVFAILTGKRM
jgi:hypothetical protein